MVDGKVGTKVESMVANWEQMKVVKLAEKMAVPKVEMVVMWVAKMVAMMARMWALRRAAASDKMWADH